MPSFENSVIYKIYCKDPNITDIYIGSSSNFRQRKYLHKESCNNCRKKPTKLYEFINNNGGWDNWEMVIITEFPCVDRAELTTEERRFIDQEKPSLNMRLAIETKSDKRKQSVKNNERSKASYEKYKHVDWTCDECNQVFKRSQKHHHQKCCGEGKEDIKNEMNDKAKERYIKLKSTPWSCPTCNAQLFLSQKHYHQKKCVDIVKLVEKVEI